MYYNTGVKIHPWLFSLSVGKTFKSELMYVIHYDNENECVLYSDKFAHCRLYLSICCPFEIKHNLPGEVNKKNAVEKISITRIFPVA